MEENKIRRIGVLTSGGDSPGMNPAIRAVVRAGNALGLEVMGINRGYKGLVKGDIFKMEPSDVSDTVQKGGTILYSARSKTFYEAEGQQRGAEMCKIFGIDGLVVIGGDGSFQGAGKLSSLGVNTVCIPGTIDLDIACTDYTIGFDTAVNTAMEAIDKIRDTSTSHARCSVVEVMGRDAGYIALWCGIVNGAEQVLIPERRDYTEESIIKSVIENRSRGKRHNLIIVAEGIGKSAELAAKIEKVTGIPSRATILGHLQRGGRPTALDRMHASMMGTYAVNLLNEGKSNRIVTYTNGQYGDIDIQEGLAMTKEISPELIEASVVLEKR